ncbi:MAG: DDE-type integrase/transposase/recombinase, partial [Geminicoccales bacterium]
EIFVKIAGKTHYLWRAIDHEGEVLETFVTKTRDKEAVLKFLKEAMKRYGKPNAIVTDGLASYGAAKKELRNDDKQQTQRYLNNQAENLHQRFRRPSHLQKFASTYASASNHFYLQRPRNYARF